MALHLSNLELAGSGNQAHRSGVGPILSVVNVVVSGIGRGLVVQSGDWSARRTGVDREERGFERQGYSADTADVGRR